MKNCFQKWGYVSNPFSTDPLTASRDGLDLLIGRKREGKKLYQKIIADAGIVTIEGENGIGKTSLINGISYSLFEDSIDNNGDVIYIPCVKTFQISQNSNQQEFIDDIYFAIAQTLIKKADEVKRISRKLPNTKNMKAWMNESEILTISAQVAGFGAGENRSLNSSGGYLKSGFKQEIRNWLKKIFPKKESGGIICCIDNLELLKTTKSAREILEFLRDELINLNGTKWIFSGSHGIIKSVIGSSRLSGFLLKPTKIERLKDINVPILLNSRIKSYQSHVDIKPYNPITEEKFVKLYNLLNGNLREVLQKLISYYLYVDENFEDRNRPDFISQKNKVFEQWLADDSQEEFDAVLSIITNKEIQLFKLIISYKSALTIHRVKKIGINTVRELIDCIKELEIAGLIVNTINHGEDLDRILKNEGHLEFSDNIFASDSIREEEIEKFVYLYDKMTTNRLKGGLEHIVSEISITPKGWNIYNNKIKE